MDNDQLQLKYKPIKVCGICGDKALGYNFNAITCEACKAFFRRNALRTKDFKCPFDGNCKIDLVTRRFCQKCRLKKCFDIGMKKEWILSEEEKRVKRDKILENRRKKESLSSSGSCHLEYGNGSTTPSSLMFHSQLSNASDNECGISNSEIMLSPSHHSISSTPTYAASSCFSDNDSSNHHNTLPQAVNSNLDNLLHGNPNHHPTANNHQVNSSSSNDHNNSATSINLNNNKDFLNSLYFLEQHQNHHNQTNNNNQNSYSPIDKFSSDFIKKSTSSSTPLPTTSSNTTPPSPLPGSAIITKTEPTTPPSSSMSPYPSSITASTIAFPTGNIKSPSSTHIQQSTIPSALYASDSSHVHLNHHSTNNKALSSLLKPDLGSPLQAPSSLHLSSSSFNNASINHNRNNDSSLASPGWATPSSTTSSNVDISVDSFMDEKVGTKSSTTQHHNQIKQLKTRNGIFNSNNLPPPPPQQQHHHYSNNHLETSASSSVSSSYSLIKPNMSFKTEPKQQEELIVVSPMPSTGVATNNHQAGHNNNTNFQLHHQLPGTPTNHYMKHASMNNNFANHQKPRLMSNADFDTMQPRVVGSKIIDQCSVISSDESEVASVYSSYNSDRNFEDVSTMDLPILLSNCSTQANHSIVKNEIEQNGYSSDDDIKNIFVQPDSFDDLSKDNNQMDKMSVKSVGTVVSGSEHENERRKNRNRTNNPSTASQPISMLQYNLSTVAPQTISKSYNCFENFRLEELNYAGGHLEEWNHSGPIFYEMAHRTEIYRVAERVIHHLISMVQMINSFTELCETDQLSLLKYSITEIMILRSVPYFILSRDAWIFNLEPNEKGTLLQFNTCQTQLPSSEFNEDIKRFIMAMPETCKNDRNLFDLITMVVLFNPNRVELKHKDLVKLEYFTYRHLLCKYIHINYSMNQTKYNLNNNMNNKMMDAVIQPENILQMIDWLQKINSKIKNILPCKIIEEKFMFRNRTRY